MKKLFLCFLLFWFGALHAAVHVRGYYRSNGTYVQPHYRTAPNSTIMDNYSTYPNINPYTGKQGTINPYGYGSRSSSGSTYYNPPVTTAPTYSNQYPAYQYNPPAVDPKKVEEEYQRIIKNMEAETQAAVTRQELVLKAESTTQPTKAYWQRIEAQATDTFYLDLTSIHDFYSYKGIWMKAMGTVGKRGIRVWGGSVLYKVIIDCRLHRFAVLSKDTYKSNGVLVESKKQREFLYDWEFQQPDSVIDKVSKEYICLK